MESAAGPWAPPPALLQALLQRFGVRRSDFGLSVLASIMGIIIATVPSRRESFEMVGTEYFAQHLVHNEHAGSLSLMKRSWLWELCRPFGVRSQGYGESLWKLSGCQHITKNWAV